MREVRQAKVLVLNLYQGISTVRWQDLITNLVSSLNSSFCDINSIIIIEILHEKNHRETMLRR